MKEWELALEVPVGLQGSVAINSGLRKGGLSAVVHQKLGLLSLHILVLIKVM